NRRRARHHKRRLVAAARLQHASRAGGPRRSGKRRRAGTPEANHQRPARRQRHRAGGGKPLELVAISAIYCRRVLTLLRPPFRFKGPCAGNPARPEKRMGAGGRSSFRAGRTPCGSENATDKKPSPCEKTPVKQGNKTKNRRPCADCRMKRRRLWKQRGAIAI